MKFIFYYTKASNRYVYGQKYTVNKHINWINCAVYCSILDLKLKKNSALCFFDKKIYIQKML